MPHVFSGQPLRLVTVGWWSDNRDNNRAKWQTYGDLDDIGEDEGGPTILLVNPWRKDLILLLDSAQAEAAGWDAVVKVGLTTADVVRTSSTVVTITLPAFASYDITAQETITATAPVSSLASGGPLTAVPTFTIDPVAGAAATTRNLLLLGAGV